MTAIYPISNSTNSLWLLFIEKTAYDCYLSHLYQHKQLMTAIYQHKQFMTAINKSQPWLFSVPAGEWACSPKAHSGPQSCASAGIASAAGARRWGVTGRGAPRPRQRGARCPVHCCRKWPCKAACNCKESRHFRCRSSRSRQSQGAGAECCSSPWPRKRTLKSFLLQTWLHCHTWAKKIYIYYRI